MLTDFIRDSEAGLTRDKRALSHTKRNRSLGDIRNPMATVSGKGEGEGEGEGNTRYLRFFNHEIHEKARKFFMGCCFDGWACKRKFGLVCCFLNYGVLGGWFLVIEPPRRQGRQVGFIELSRLCGYKALNEVLGRGARVSLDYTGGHVHTAHIFLRHRRLTMLNPRL